ncbi:hypothetical protein L2E82_32459 [Cichorium intybus]|uniref:Uncharacterized protein n=1 Tax=Cichorium intybus TaxID=13427 RepID=A0ACB9BHL9_CICIN|nr:hypothetical protein L2E82_32459 [Cichorium intybus]
MSVDLSKHVTTTVEQARIWGSTNLITYNMVLVKVSKTKRYGGEEVALSHVNNMEEGMMKPLTINSDNSLESELDLILRQRDSRVVDDQQRDLNMNRSGSAPPTVEGSLSAVGNLFRDSDLVQIDNRNSISTKGVLTEDELRSHPMYLAYYYAHGNFNPRLPPPLLSKEDWRIAQRFQIGGSSSEGTRDWWKKNESSDSGSSSSSSLFSMQPGLAAGMGSRRKSFADILQEGLEQPASSSNRISRPASQNAISDVMNMRGISNSHPSSLCNEKETSQDPSRFQNFPHPFAPAVGSSLSRGIAPDQTQMVRRAHSPGMPPLSKRCNVGGHNTLNDLPDVASSLSGLNISKSRLPDGDNDSQSSYLVDVINDHRLSFQHQIDDRGMDSKYDFSRENANLPDLNVRKSAIDGPINFHRRATSSADLSSHRNMYEFSNLESSSMRNQVDNFMDLSSQMPVRYSSVIDHLASASNPNTSRNGQFLRRCNYPPVSSLHSPVTGPRHAQCMVNTHSANLPLGKNNFVVSHGHEDIHALQKAYLEALLAQHNQQYSSPLFGRSGSLNHLYGNPTYNHGIPYQGNLLENPTRPSVGSRPLSQQERTMQFAPFRNSRGVSGSWNLEGDISLDRRYISSLLDELKNNKNKSFELSDVVDHVIEFSTDQYGSRFIQQKLELATAEEKNIIFPEIIPHARSLMTDVFGNYVIQKFFEHGTKSQRRELASQLIGHVLPLSLQMYGCRVIQKALEVVEVDQQTQMVAELDGSVMKCVRDQNGNHVIQKCIECVPQNRVQFIVSSFFGQVVSLSSHPYGCRVIQRVLEHCNDPTTQVIMDEIMNSVCTLAQDQYGNYVIQHILQHGKPHERSDVINKITGQTVKMSLQKFASNVVEKCLTYGSLEERQLLVNEMLGATEENEPLQAMMKDPFGNYVVQKVLETCDDQTHELILSRIKVHLAALKRYTFGKHIVSRVEKLVTSGERHIASSSRT